MCTPWPATRAGSGSTVSSSILYRSHVPAPVSVSCLDPSRSTQSRALPYRWLPHPPIHPPHALSAPHYHPYTTTHVLQPTLNRDVEHFDRHRRTQVQTCAKAQQRSQFQHKTIGAKDGDGSTINIAAQIRELNSKRTTLDRVPDAQHKAGSLATSARPFLEIDYSYTRLGASIATAARQTLAPGSYATKGAAHLF